MNAARQWLAIGLLLMVLADIKDSRAFAVFGVVAFVMALAWTFRSES